MLKIILHRLFLNELRTSENQKDGTIKSRRKGIFMREVIRLYALLSSKISEISMHYDQVKTVGSFLFPHF